jgi:hypothetical protein
VDEARFADPGRTEKREEPACFVSGGTLEGRLEEQALALSTNERRIETLRVTGEAGGDGKQSKRSRPS